MPFGFPPESAFTFAGIPICSWPLLFFGDSTGHKSSSGRSGPLQAPRLSVPHMTNVQSLKRRSGSHQPGRRAAVRWFHPQRMQILIRRIHIYTGLLTFAHLMLYGIAGLVATMQPGPERPKNAGSVRYVPVTMPSSATDKEVARLV